MAASNSARDTSLRTLSRRARIDAERVPAVSRASSPTTDPGPSCADHLVAGRPPRGAPPGARTRSPPRRRRGTARRRRRGADRWAPRSSAVRTSSGSRLNSGSGRDRRGRRPGRLDPSRAGAPRSGAADGSSGSSVAGRIRPRNMAMTATATKQATDIHQPSRKESTEVAGVGVPMMTTSRAMPRTPPICRVLEATADAVAYRPPGTAASVALPSSGRVMPDPDAAEHLAGQPLGQERRGRAHLRGVPDVARAGPDQRPRDDEQPVAALRGDRAEDGRDDGGDQRRGHQRQAGTQDAVAPDVGQPQDVRQQVGVEAHAGSDRGDVADLEGADLQQLGVEQRRPVPPGAGHEQDQEQRPTRRSSRSPPSSSTPSRRPGRSPG